LLCPAMVTAALPLGVAGHIPIASCYTNLFNLLNFPAGVVPVGVRVLRALSGHWSMTLVVRLLQRVSDEDVDMVSTYPRHMRSDLAYGFVAQGAAGSQGER
jgi:hypothetical protein